MLGAPGRQGGQLPEGRKILRKNQMFVKKRGTIGAVWGSLGAARQTNAGTGRKVCRTLDKSKRNMENNKHRTPICMALEGVLLGI